jgi:CHAT domain-containing protein
VALSLNNLAMLYKEQGRYAEAEPLLQQSLKIKRKVLNEDHPDVALRLNNLAGLYHDQGRYAEAEPLYQQSLKIKRKVLNEDHPDVALSLNNLAMLYEKQGRYAEAEPLLDHAIRILSRPDVAPGSRCSSIELRAHVRWTLGRREQGLEDLRQAMALAEQFRARASGGETERATAFAQKAYVFAGMVAWQTELGGSREGLDAMERSRARSLLDQLELRGADLLAGLPQSQAQPLKRRETEAQARVAELRKRLELLPRQRGLSPDQRRQREEELMSGLRQAQRQAAEAYADIRNASPAYRQAVGKDRKPVALDTLQTHAQKHHALVLEYLIGSDGAYLLVVPGDSQPRLMKLVVEDGPARALGIKPGPMTHSQLKTALAAQDKDGLLARLRRCTGPEQERELAQALAALWKVLIPEAERKALVGGQYRRLIVLPDGPLARLPFEVLVVQPGDQPRYLLDVGPVIEYAPSATILINLAERNFGSVGQAKERILTVGDCRYKEPGGTEPDALLAQLTTRSRYRGAGGGLTPLYFSGKEMSWVSHNFDRHGLPVAALKGATATEKNFHMAVPGRRVVHLACHGLVDEAYGNLFGALALTPGPDANDPADDGFLTVAEVYGLDLQACELVILSACDSNVGPQQRGEGVWALSRGFLVAGARRVVASNWLVDDEAAASLISHFCGGLALSAGQRARPDYGQCLYEAKRWVRQQEKWSSPYYWGTFVLIGPQ